MSNSFEDIESRAVCLLNNREDNYWHYSRKNAEDILLYTEKSPIYETPSKQKFHEGSDVLVRWTDGLLYLGNIIKVEDEYSRCAVKFEDGSQYWALFKDIHKGPPPTNEIICTVCDSGASDPPDEIVICDTCCHGYHQYCHVPKIDSNVLKPDVAWACRKCVFACTTRKGGAVKKGTKAQAMQVMKQTLPYDLQSLTWDVPHRSNFQQTYCYCGGPGEWYMKMLQCLKCKQWFHEACLQCLDMPLLYGDRFYIFICAVCNKGSEFLRRISLRWPDIAHLVLFNLTIIHGKKYFDLDSTVMHFLKDKWSQLEVKGEELSRSSLEDKKAKMLETLQSNKSRFKSGKEVKRKTALWGLISRVPPPVPVVVLPDSVPITDEVFDSFRTGRKAKTVVKNEKVPAPQKKNRKPSSLMNDNCDTSSQNSIVQVRREEEAVKKEENRNWSRRRLRSRSARKFSQSSPVSHSELSDSEDTSSSHGTLNSIIPQPNNFDGPNNPFRNCEQSSSLNPKSSAASTASSQSSSSQSRRTRRLRHRPSVQNSNSSKKNSLINNLIGSPHFNKQPNPKFLITQSMESGVSPSDVNLSDLNSSMNSYFGAENRIADGEKFVVLAKRIDPHGRVQYLIEWECLSS